MQLGSNFPARMLDGRRMRMLLICLSEADIQPFPEITFPVRFRDACSLSDSNDSHK
jgi:hypothetical protein